MERDLEDTRLSAPRTPDVERGVDVEDTVVRGSVVAPAAPPELVEPPAPERRPLPLVVEPVVPVVSLADSVVEPPPPPSFRVLLADGTEIVVDVPVYVGRRPSAPRIHTGPPPRLVTLASPGKELSATHLELKVVGGSLVASDMRSTNGTVVQLPGSPPRTLIRGESAVVVPGTRIDLGEGAVLDVLGAVTEAS